MFKERFKNERLRLGLTQEQLSKKLGISRSNLANWENGSNVASQEMLIKSSKLFNCSVDYLLGISDYRNIYEKFDNEINIQEIKNDLKVLNNLNKDIVDDLNLNSFYTFTEEQINSDTELPKNDSDILLDKLKELGLLSINEELNDKELNVILNFIENNKDMLKTMIENKKGKE